ncbi:MAG: cytochrome c biogenesis protein CcsA [Phycisphaerales bacterium]|nr:cytochrome c biogenesis protein CcsA [Phycisphaerales bacterium]
MPLDTYARHLASEVTGRSKWRARAGPAGYSGRQPVQLLCDAMFRSKDLMSQPLIGLENRPFKQRVGLNPEQRFFTAMEIMSCRGLHEVLDSFGAAQQANQSVQPNREQRMALDLQGAVGRLSMLGSGEGLALVPTGAGKAFLRVGTATGEPGTESVRAAMQAMAQAYASGASMEAPVDAFIAAVTAAGTIDAKSARQVSLEMFYNRHSPWKMTAYGYGLALVLFGLSRLMLRRPLLIASFIAGAFGVAEHLLGLSLRIVILDRAPVSNTYESLLWMGLVGVGLGLVAQAINRRAWYLFGGVAVAFLSVLFSNLVPLETRSGALPAVLRSNYWLILHVLTVVASYGVLAVASLLGHVYLFKEVLIAKKGAVSDQPVRLSHPLIAQTYRSIQLGVLLLTAGTILGGIWAADSWGRFWGWDPKETWALISIVVYFAVLHARYVRWLQDFGMAASAVLGFAAIVWTFYGVNYLMAAGLHSYGFGSGGGSWVAIWAIGEIIFVVACKIRQRSLLASAPVAVKPAATINSGPAGTVPGLRGGAKA